VVAVGPLTGVDCEHPQRREGRRSRTSLGVDGWRSRSTSLPRRSERDEGRDFTVLGLAERNSAVDPNITTAKASQIDMNRRLRTKHAVGIHTRSPIAHSAELELQSIPA
jgi:hypothetical protein